MNVRTVISCLLILLVGCTAKVEGTDGGGDDDDAGLAGATLEIAPDDVTISVVDGVGPDQEYTAIIHYQDGSTADVSADTSYSVDDARLGSFDGSVFTAHGATGGESTVRAAYRGVLDTATITVDVTEHRVIGSAPADAPTWFDGATENAGLAPTIVYPADGTMVPPNLGDFEVHWTDSAGCDLFEVRLTSSHVDLRLYVTGTPNQGSWAAYLPEEWSTAGGSTRGGTLQSTVRGMVSSATDSAGTSTPVDVDVTDQEVEGGIYYWAASGDPYGIFRHDMGRPGEPAEQYYTSAESGRCVACHVLSRDGTKMAVTYDGGNGAAAMVDVASRGIDYGEDPYFWNFATFEPDGDRILTVSKGLMTLRDTATGNSLGTVTTPGGYGTHPDFSPDGDAIVYVAPSSPGSDWDFTGGAIITQSFDPGSGTFGSPVTLVAAGAQNNYYPSWSPDAQWILFNRSNGEESYDAASAQLWLVKADGSQAPFQLATPDLGTGLTNSWARWAPFEQALGEETPEPFFWFTFSSKRAFGVRMAQGARPQVWMAPFFPGRVGGEPSAPAFRLPFQDLATSNHIAQWTEEVVPID